VRQILKSAFSLALARLRAGPAHYNGKHAVIDQISCRQQVDGIIDSRTMPVAGMGMNTNLL
jgi:hypothetical protein